MEDMKDNFEKIDFCDYPYLGIGEKPGGKILTDEQLEKIIGG